MNRRSALGVTRYLPTRDREIVRDKSSSSVAVAPMSLSLPVRPLFYCNATTSVARHATERVGTVRRPCGHTVNVVCDLLFATPVWLLFSLSPPLFSGLAATLPEDLYCLIKKAVSVRKHLEKNRKDKDSKFRLILIESRIHRLARYYKRMKAVAPTFKYESATASTLVA